MYQPSATNFIGRDPMQWWIGQVTDPDKGEWGDALEKTRAADWDKDQKEIYSHRCRVRIVGYHGCEDDLADKDLPLAHVLLPPNTTTTGGCGETMQYQGGEVVVGFFFDGADGQQPVIFGTLFKQSFIKDELTSAQFNAKKQTCFVPYTPPKVKNNLGKNQVTVNSPGDYAFTDGEYKKDVAHNQKEDGTNTKTDNATACQDNEITKITNTIKDFTQKIQTLQSLNSANTFVNPIYGGIVDIQSEIKLTSNILDVYNQTLLGHPAILKKGNFKYYIDRTSETWDSWEDWCEKVVWWSNKKGAYLYDCLVEENQRKIKSKIPVIRIESEPFGSDARYQLVCFSYSIE